MTTPEDPRLMRPRDDALPSHRLCPGCSKVLPLDSEHFYVNRNRYAWQLSRYMPRCIECHRAAVRADYRANKAKRNARTVATNRVRRENVRQLGAAGLESFRRTAVARKEAEHARKERKAKVKRQMLKLYGPRPDGIKAMIRARSRMYAERRLSSPEEPYDLRRPAQDFRDLEAIRTRHRSELARRDSPHGNARTKPLIRVHHATQAKELADGWTPCKFVIPLAFDQR